MCSEHYCSTEARSSWYLELVCTQLIHTDLTLILTELNWLGNGGQNIREEEVRKKTHKGHKVENIDTRGDGVKWEMTLSDSRTHSWSRRSVVIQVCGFTCKDKKSRH